MAHKPHDHRAHGRWVKTSTEIPGAFKSPDGKYVGIFQLAHRPSDVSVEHGVKALAQAIAVAADGGTATAIIEVPAVVPEHVVFVRPDGGNLMRLDDKGDALTRVCVDPALLSDLEACVIPDDIAALPAVRG